ncbi:hypothetical protein BDP27DRAFT_1357522 [Rhodocollybia butyracea]|uniref:RRM domain-containing protein n=1 Tax=Rhodocollybia butyracea TaxID=206335 RepID=A0A9P5UGG3_9AGAR|nr:hypothetical protein BDP27DRAFT_1357522 [Rhodocollybia butyracea]
MPQQDSGPHPHPYLHEPLLYITNVPTNVSDETLGIAFVPCAPFRPKIVRDTTSPFVSGTIEFKFLESAEKALATLQSRPIPGPGVPLVLSPYPPTNPPTPLPPPSALPRLIKHLPMTYGDSNLYDLFRPYGALASVRIPTHFGPDTGMVEFWNEDDARAAEDAMHCADVEGQNIAVQVYQPRRTASGSINEFNTNAPSFVPSGSVFAYPNPAATYSPPRPHYSPRSPVSPIPHGGTAQFVHGPGQQVQLAPLSGPGSNSHSGLIDPCNLFCKNLDPEIDSNALFSHFRQFGQIVSARVMRNEAGESRGFGFVSYQMPDQAANAMHAMNGITLGSKQVVVRLHEPKQLRQEKLAQRFGSGSNGHPRTASGATSPTASEGGDSYAAGWGSPSPRNRTLGLGGSPSSHYGGLERPDRGRRGSGSYYNAAYSGTLNLPMRYDDLAALSPVVRKEVLTGELSRRVKSLGTVSSNNVDSVVESLVNVSLSEIVQAIDDPEKLAHQVDKLKVSQNLSTPASPSPTARSTSASQDSRLLDPNALAATASAPEHPSTPISVNASLSTPPRTSSPSGSVPPTSERERMAAAVAKFENSPSEKQEQLTELLMSLPKRERAMCLFNMEVFRAKLADARLVLETMEEDEESATGATAAPSTTIPPSTPQNKKTSAFSSTLDGSPQTPDLSSRGPSAASSPLPSTPALGTPAGAGNPTYTIAALAKMPAVEVLKVVRSSSTVLPAGLSKADPLVVQATDEFVDGLMDKPSQMQKQQLGEKLFKVVKSFGVKGAPKVTVTLLDQEDLRSLAHLMNSYPAVLKDKAQTVAPAK